MNYDIYPFLFEKGKHNLFLPVTITFHPFRQFASWSREISSLTPLSSFFFSPFEDSYVFPLLPPHYSSNEF